MAEAGEHHPKRHVIGWLLDRGERAELLRRYTPAYPDVIADHVTLSSGAEPQSPPQDTSAEIVGHADDHAGVQAMVVKIAGTTDRPDGSTYHITWSIDRAKGRKAVHSNDVIRTAGWTALPRPIPISLKGAALPGEP
jgi:hypothetical protein